MKYIHLVPKSSSYFKNMVIPNLSSLYLVSYLRSKNIDAAIWDENVQGLMSDNLLSDIDYMGLSLYGRNNKRSLARLREIKKKHWGITTIVGGSSVGNDFSGRHSRYINYVVEGRGYRPLLNILNSSLKLYNGNVRIPRDNYNPMFAVDYSLLPSGYSFPIYLASSGCYHRCTYCLASKLGNYRERYRHYVLSEVFQTKGYYEFFDNNFFTVSHSDKLIDQLPKDRAWGALADLRPLGFSNGHLERNIGLAIGKGMVNLGIGVESLDNSVLSAVRKGYTREEAIKGLEIISGLAKGKTVYGFLMYGLPNQTYESHLSDIYILEKYGILLVCNPLWLIRGTDLWSSMDPDNYMVDPSNVVMSTKWITGAEVGRLDLMSNQLNDVTYSKVWSKEKIG